MVAIAPGLPTRFPCWCRAVYSWGGETKRDLGFVEGDLIECLNAGDGSWWMGRLKRDRRVAGLFPSNFVQVLDESFQPNIRATSPLPPLQNGNGMNSRGPTLSPSPGPAAISTPVKASRSPNKSFRKPFQAYARASSPNPDALERDNSSNTIIRSSQPTSRMQSSRDDAPYHNVSRGPSPAMSFYQSHCSRDPSPEGGDGFGSSPPPPAPPPHRVAYDSRTAASPIPPQDYSGRPHPGQRSPAPSNGHHGLGNTPSPLRDAMDDVMTSLHDMGVHDPHYQSNHSHAAPWSPDDIEQPRNQRGLRTRARPITSLGIGGRDEDGGNQYDPSSSRDVDDGNPYMGNYVARMESRLRQMQQASGPPKDELFLPPDQPEPKVDTPLIVPLKKSASNATRPHSSLDRRGGGDGSTSSKGSGHRLRTRKSAYELGRQVLGRTFTIRSNATNSSSGVQSNSTETSNSTQLTSQSIMSGRSAGGFSATSAGSLARRKGGVPGIGHERPATSMDTYRTRAARGTISYDDGRPHTPSTGITYHSRGGSRAGPSFQETNIINNSNGNGSSTSDWQGGNNFNNNNNINSSSAVFGGLTAPRPKKSGFFKKIMESAKTGAAYTRSTIVVGQATPPQSPLKSMLPNGVSAITGGGSSTAAARDMGLGGGGGGGGAHDWVQVRRDVNRSNSLSRHERAERAERCQMLDFPVIHAVDDLYELIDGDEGADGRPVHEPMDLNMANLSLVDKSARFVNSLPPLTNSTSLAQGYVCRPYKSDVQRLRAIFTWVSEKISWEEDYEGGVPSSSSSSASYVSGGNQVDTRHVIQSKRGSAEEVAVLVMEMCGAMGIHCEVVRGHLKAPGEQLDRATLETVPRGNHWWNCVLVDGAWRMLDCSLAGATNPRRALYSSAASNVAESWWFLARPLEICYTHVPLHADQQHLCPPVPFDVLLSLPCACPPYFRNGLRLFEYDTSLLRVEDLDMVHLHFTLPADVECVAEMEARAFQRDADGDYFESGDVVRKRALAQAEWVGGLKRYTVKALLPGDDGQGVLKVYAGKRGLMHSIKDNPHPLAFAVPVSHTGTNPPYEFLSRHPTPHAQRHDLYVAQPQCAFLALNNTFVFAVRQHPSTPAETPTTTAASAAATVISSGRITPSSFLIRPTSAMSMTSSSAAGSTSNSNSSYSASSSAVTTAAGGGSTNSAFTQKKPAKLAIQAPSGKIIRLMRKSEHTISTSGPGGGEAGDGGVWETIIKCGERGVWRGLVLADRSARWCVFAEWTCI
ncbi:MAG: hypothetical protein M1825_005813 [Sarcosagium campestre]|nr:MAG: hypothetical protein M1825_005813 [Sarcosagium campestre]